MNWTLRASSFWSCCSLICVSHMHIWYTTPQIKFFLFQSPVILCLKNDPYLSSQFYKIYPCLVQPVAIQRCHVLVSWGIPSLLPGTKLQEHLLLWPSAIYTCFFCGKLSQYFNDSQKANSIQFNQIIINHFPRTVLF